MNRRQLLLSAFALALTVPAVPAWPQLCAGDDGFASVSCCTPVNPRIPRFPQFSMEGTYACIKDCALEAVFPVALRTQHIRVLCDLDVVTLTVTPASPISPGFNTVMIAKYARTWREVDQTGQFDRQIWRYLVNGDFVVTAGQRPCPTPPDPNKAPHFHGHIDYACEQDAAGNQKYFMAMSLSHLPGCIEHNLFSCVPLTPPNDHQDRSYHLVAPANFRFAPVGESNGSIPAESFRSMLFPTGLQCLGEGQIMQGSLDTTIKNCVCQPGLTGPFQWAHQRFAGVVQCAGGNFPFQGIPLVAPLPPLPTGLVSLGIGGWTGPPNTFPGVRELVIHWGFLDFVDPCNRTDLPVHIVQGVSTRNARGLVFGQVPPGPYNTFMDLGNMLRQVTYPTTSFVPGWGCLYFTKVVWNLNLP